MCKQNYLARAKSHKNGQEFGGGGGGGGCEVGFEDTKGVIRIRISKNRQHNGQKRKYKRTNDLQNIPIKLKIE